MDRLSARLAAGEAGMRTERLAEGVAVAGQFGVLNATALATLMPTMRMLMPTMRRRRRRRRMPTMRMIATTKSLMTWPLVHPAVTATRQRLIQGAR
jgi:hypothetical protein